jgi:AcrR family transcriptional regulator
MRKNPQQRRSKQTIDDIFEAAARIFETDNEPAIDTNGLAARAGVSIGTLYYYFSDKISLLRAMALREVERQEQRFMAIIASGQRDDPAALMRAMVREALVPLNGRQRVRRRLFDILGTDPVVRRALYDTISRVTDRFLEGLGTDPSGVPPARRYILLRSILGPVRAAVFGDPQMLASQDFEDELVRLMTLLIGD